MACNNPPGHTFESPTETPMCGLADCCKPLLQTALTWPNARLGSSASARRARGPAYWAGLPGLAVLTKAVWPFGPKQCGSLDQNSVAVLVMTPLSVAFLVVVILECSRFDWFTRTLLRGERPISVRTYFRHICSLGVNFMQLRFFVLNWFLIQTLDPSPDFLVNSYTQN